MKTLWSAAAVGDEKKLGSLEVGKLADLVVLGGELPGYSRGADQ